MEWYAPFGWTTQYECERDCVPDQFEEGMTLLQLQCCQYAVQYKNLLLTHEALGV